MNKFCLKLGMVVSSLVLVLSAAKSVDAWEMKKGGDISLTSKDVLNGSQLLVGNNINVKTKIDGDLICAGQNITISGEVTGDVLCAGQSLTINGKVDGNVRIAGQMLTINGVVSKNANLFGQQVMLGDKSEIMGELFTASSDVTANGKVLKTWVATAANVNVNGNIADTKFIVKKLSLGKTAVVNGRLVYQSSNDAVVATGARLLKGQEKQLPQEKVTAEAKQNFWMMPTAMVKGFYFGSKVVELMIGVLLGLVVVLLFPKWLDKTAVLANKKMGKSLLWGVIVAAVAPVVLVLMVITLIGIPLAMVTGMVLAIWVGLAHIAAATAIGSRIIAKNTLMWRWLVGYIVLWVVGLVPVVGWLLSAVAVLTGVGAVKLSLHKQK